MARFYFSSGATSNRNMIVSGFITFDCNFFKIFSGRNNKSNFLELYPKIKILKF